MNVVHEWLLPTVAICLAQDLTTSVIVVKSASCAVSRLDAQPNGAYVAGCRDLLVLATGMFRGGQ